MEIQGHDSAGVIPEQGLPLQAALLTVALCMLFGANAVAVKISLTGLGVFTTAGLRFSIASLTIFLWAYLTGRPLVLSRSQLFQLIPLGLVFWVQLSLFYLGLSRTTASHGTLVANALPFGVMVLAHFFIPGDRISRKKILGLLLGFGGVLVLFKDSLGLSDDILVGDLYILAAIVIWSGNAIYSKRILPGFRPYQVMLYPMLISAPLFLLSGFLFDGAMVRFVDGRILLSMLYQTFVTASFGMVAWVTMMKKYGATALHSFVFVMPISGVFFGILILNEPLTFSLIGAIVLVSAGLLVINRNGRVRG